MHWVGISLFHYSLFSLFHFNYFLIIIIIHYSQLFAQLFADYYHYSLFSLFHFNYLLVLKKHTVILLIQPLNHLGLVNKS